MPTITDRTHAHMRPQGQQFAFDGGDSTTGRDDFGNTSKTVIKRGLYQSTGGSSQIQYIFHRNFSSMENQPIYLWQP